MTRIALFGGSFNPPHVAHQLVALYVLETEAIDELWFVPTYAHPFGKALAPYADRVAMCELAAAALGPRAKVSRAEETLAMRPGFVASRTLDLVEHLSAPDRELRLVIGTDILGDTAKWYRWDEVIARAPVIVVNRPGHGVATGVTMPDISATLVRAELAKRTAAERLDPHGPLHGLLPATILRYIAEHDLYS